MREIKFRVWVNDMLIYQSDFDNYAITLDGKILYYQNCPESEFSTEIYIVGVNIQLMQFTGLKDKNGKEIYEGDILELKKAGYINSVIWDEDLARWALNDWHMDWHNPDDRKNFEVIGNICENPELIK